MVLGGGILVAGKIDQGVDWLLESHCEYLGGRAGLIIADQEENPSLDVHGPNAVFGQV